MTVTEAPTKRQFIPGQPDMWAFVLFETLVFTSYFVVYLILRSRHEEIFLRGQAALDLHIGILNTVVLLSSSWAVAHCVASARAGRYRSALTGAVMTLALGAVFLALKIYEWAAEIARGNSFDSSEFFQHYYFLTAIHCLHLLIGFVVMGVVVYQLAGPRRRSQELIETGATYWHTVDFLWVMIFALIYVAR